MPILYPSTIELAKYCANLVVRAAALALTWFCILGIGVGLNWLVNWILKSFMAPDFVVSSLSHTVVALVVTLVLAATLTSFKDILSLTLESLKSTSGPSDSSGKGPNDV